MEKLQDVLLGEDKEKVVITQEQSDKICDLLLRFRKRVSEKDITIDLLKHDINSLEHENEILNKFIANYMSVLCTPSNPYN